MADLVAWLLKRPEYASDIALAFQFLGWRAECLDEHEMMRRMAAGEKPTMIITNKAGKPYGHRSPKGTTNILEMSEERDIPLVWWLLDSWFHSPDLIDLNQQAVAICHGLPPILPMSVPDARNLWCFSVSKANLHRLKGNCQEYLPFGVNTDRFKPMPEIEKKYDVGFIGSSLISVGVDGVAMLEQAGVLDKVKAGLDVEDKATAESWRILTDVRLSAQDRIDACVASKAHVWGNGWEQVVPDGITWHGKCDYADLPTVINSCYVNLNISKRCFPDDIAPRILELLACGSVVNSNPLDGLWKEFKDCCYWWTKPVTDGLVQDVKRALSTGCYSELGYQGRKLVVAKHQWRHRVERIIEFVL